jgi:hypothetical protein
MRILLYHTPTGMFFQSPDQWTSNPESADDFKNSPKAILFARERGLTEVEVLWDFDDPEYNVRLPVNSHTQTEIREAA